jgi:predicted transcriptional regulator
MKKYEQIEFENLQMGHGGKRKGAGRTKSKPESITIRIDKKLLPIIEKLKEEIKKESNEKILAIEKLLNTA